MPANEVKKMSVPIPRSSRDEVKPSQRDLFVRDRSLQEN